MITDVVNAVHAIYTLSRAIQRHVQEARANKAQCKRLGERICSIADEVKSLERIKDSERYLAPLRSLHGCLEESKVFVMDFASDKKWFAKVMNARKNRSQFQYINDQLERAIQDLNLGLIAQQLMNREHDRLDEEKDKQYIQANQEEIIRLQHEHNSALQKLNVDQRERERILMQQLASMRGAFDRFMAKGENPVAQPELRANWLVPFHEVHIDEKLAESLCGNIYLGKWRDENVAIKTFEGLADAEERKLFTREVKILCELRSDYIVRLYKACDEFTPCIIMEYMSQGALYDLIERNTYTLQQKKDIALSIAKGLNYLHHEIVWHRDLHSHNILLNAEGKAKLSGFGLSKSHALSILSVAERTSAAVAWKGPECLQRQPQESAASDVYSFGVVLWELISQKHPFQGVSTEEICRRVLAGEREAIVDPFPVALRDVVTQCWHANPVLRPNIASVIKLLDAYQPEIILTSEEYYVRGQNFEKAEDWRNAYEDYERAAKMGHVKANTNVGYLLLRGLGTTMNKTEAYNRFLSSAERNHPRAMVNLARMLETGDGIPKNIAQSLHWYTQGSERGDEQSSKKARQLRAKISREEMKIMRPVGEGDYDCKTYDIYKY